MNNEHYFSGIAGNYGDKSHRSIFKLVRWYETKLVMNAISPLSYRRILDLGAGAGHFTNLLSKNAVEVYANDISPAMLDQIQNIKVKKVCGDMNSIQLEETFDLVTVLGALEFSSDPMSLLRKVSNWLTPKGTFIIMAPTRTLLGHAYRLYYQRKNIRIRLHSKKELIRQLNTAGFKVVSASTVFPFNHLIVATKA